MTTDDGQDSPGFDNLSQESRESTGGWTKLGTTVRPMMDKILRDAVTAALATGDEKLIARARRSVDVWEKAKVTPVDELLTELEKPRADHPMACPTCKGLGVLRLHSAAHYQFQATREENSISCPDCDNGTANNAHIYQVHLRASGMENHRHVTFEAMAGHWVDGQPWADAIMYAARPDTWLALIGSPYTGKTTVARCIANEWLLLGKKVMFRSVPELLDEIRNRMNGDAYQTTQELFKTVPCLILDDFGRQNDTPWATDKLFQITSGRFDDGLPTVITTNVTMEDMALDPNYQRLYQRLVDVDRCLVLPFVNAPNSWSVAPD